MSTTTCFRRTFAPEGAKAAAGNWSSSSDPEPASAGHDGKEAAMKVSVGDRLMADGDHGRVGVVIGLRNPDGSPPYVVRWLSDGHIAMIFPGPYTRIVPGDHPADAAEPAAG
jgi:Domain of unknown function (DUF1918)